MRAATDPRRDFDGGVRYQGVRSYKFRYWENAHYQSSNELYEEEEFARQREAWRAHAADSPGVVAWWCLNRTQFSEAFGDTHNGLLPADAC